MYVPKYVDSYMPVSITIASNVIQVVQNLFKCIKVAYAYKFIQKDVIVIDFCIVIELQ